MGVDCATCQRPVHLNDVCQEGQHLWCRVEEHEICKGTKKIVPGKKWRKVMVFCSPFSCAHEIKLP